MSVALPQWAPTVEQVAALSPAYTRGAVDGEGEDAGAERGTFDATTDPTRAEVEGMILAAVEEVRGRVGVPPQCLEEHAELARRTAAWHVAASIEAEKAPGDANEAAGAYSWKQSSYVACLKSLEVQAQPVLVA